MSYLLGLFDWALSLVSFSFLSSSTFFSEANFSCSIFQKWNNKRSNTWLRSFSFPWFQTAFYKNISLKFSSTEAHLSLFNFLFLLFQKSRGDASYVILGTQQQGPQVLHELTGILPVQEACQVDLHHLAVRMLQHTHEGGRERPYSHWNAGRHISEGGRIPLMGLPTLYSSLNYSYEFSLILNMLDTD